MNEQMNEQIQASNMPTHTYIRINEETILIYHDLRDVDSPVAADSHSQKQQSPTPQRVDCCCRTSEMSPNQRKMSDG